MREQAAAAYRELREQITSWALPPGAHLVETDLADRLGVSRTPLREALGRLRHDGLVNQEPGRGTVVSSVTAEDAVAIYQARDALESYALRLAAEGAPAAFRAFADEFARLAAATPAADDIADCSARFDAAVLESAQTPVIASLLADVDGTVQRLRRLAAGDDARLRESCLERRRVAMALSTGDGAAAAAANSARLRSSLDAVLSRLLQHLAPPIQPNVEESLPLRETQSGFGESTQRR